MSVWPHFSKSFPCLACGDTGTWCCRYGDTHYVCMRTPSDHTNKDGGWLHKFGDEVVKPVKRWKPAPLKRDVSNVAIVSSASRVIDLADKLGVTFHSLKLLQVGWSDVEQAYIFPMRDGQNNIVGYNRRFLDGSKKVIAGTSAGLYIPQVETSDSCYYLPEGATDTAAMLTLGITAVLGRFSCNSGTPLLKTALRARKAARIVIVADNDDTKDDGRNPGIDGAKKLKKELPWPSVIWMPPSPIKDVREFLKRGGTRKKIEADINQMVWKVGL